MMDIKGEGPFKGKRGEGVTRQEFEEAVEMYADTVFRAALSVTRSREDAEDAMQETMLKLYRSGMEFESADHTRFWLIRVAINEARRTYRWRNRVAPLEELGDIPFEAPEESGLYEAVMSLPERYRVPVYLFYYEDMSTETIAKILRCPVSTVGTRLSRARERLKKILEEDTQ